MPRLEDIEQFKEVLDSLGEEKEIRSEKGEEKEDLPPPEQGLSSDLTDLLGIPDEGKEAGEPEPAQPISEPEAETPAPVPEGEDFDLSQLDSLIEGAEVHEEGPPSSEPQPGFEPAQGGAQDIVPPSAPESEIQIEQPETPIGEEFDVSQLDSLLAGSEPAGEETPPPPSPGQADFADFELPDISDITEPPPEGIPPSEGEQAGPPVSDEDLFAGLTDLDTGAEAPTMEEAGVEMPPLEEPTMEEAEFQVPEFEPSAPLGEEIAAAGPEETPQGKGEEEEFALDEFSLPDFGEEYGLGAEAEAPSPPTAEPAVSEAEEQEISLPVSGELPEAVGEDIRLSDKEFDNLRQTLAGLPRNLKIIIEELIGEKELKGNNLRALLDLLIQGQSPREIAAIVSGITGKKISLPRRYEKKTGMAFEHDKESLAYIFKHKLGPAFLFAALGIFVLIALALFGYQFIYQPLAAISVYQEGYDKVLQGDYAGGNQKFEEARRIWDYKDQYYRFAAAFRQKEQYKLAEQKYQALLKKYPYDEKGALDYANLLTFEGSYKEANDILNTHILNKELFNYQGLLAAADNYLQWGDVDSSRYEDALRTYQQLHDRYPTQNEVMLRLLNYFIHVNNPVQVEWYKNYFKGQGYEPADTEIYARLAGYLIDRQELDDVKDILNKALAADNLIPETYYEFARYYNQLNQPELEGKVLTAAPDIFKRFFENNPEKRTPGRIKQYILTYNLLGEYYYNQKGFSDTTEAERNYTQAINLFELARRSKEVGMDPAFGKIYANLGDIYYYVDEHFTLALEKYIQAQNNMYNPPDLRYKIGYIYYQRKDYENALLEFYGASAEMRNNPAILFALANTLYKRKAYSSALGNYIYLLGLLEDQKNSIAILRPEDNPVHNALMEKLYITFNNLGVTYYELALATRDQEKVTEGLEALENSAGIFDVLSRNPDTMARLESTKSATSSQLVKKAAPEPYANMDIIMHSKDIEPVIYDDLPMDIHQMRFRKKDQV
jgi:hypothetical protein